MNGTVLSYTSAAQVMKAPPGFYASAAFAHLRWTLAGEQRDERIRLFVRKLLKRLDGMEMPFYVVTGLMSHKVAAQRYVVGHDPWKPIENPFLDGVAVRLKHSVHDHLDVKCWELFAEIAFDVARLAAIPILWGGVHDPGYFQIYDGHVPDGMEVDARTYGYRRRGFKG